MTWFMRPIVCAGLALAGCGLDDGVASLSGPAALWVAPLPSQIRLSWWKSGSDCVPYACSEFVPYAVNAVTCDACDVLMSSPAGFSPATPAVLSSFHDQTFSLFVTPRIGGPISFSADLESTSGAHQTVSFSRTADRVTAIAATCMQTRAYDGQTGPCGTSRAPSDDISIVVTATTAGLGEVPLSDLLEEVENDMLPTMSPDPASWDWGTTSVDPTTTALAETLRWTVGDTTLTATVALPPLAP